MQFIIRYFIARTLYYFAKVLLRLTGRAIHSLLRSIKTMLAYAWRAVLWIDSRSFYWSPYMLGYQGRLMPRWLRRVFAGSHWHRCWLAGHMGIYAEQGQHYGVCDRQWYRTRANSPH